MADEKDKFIQFFNISTEAFYDFAIRNEVREEAEIETEFESDFER